MLFRELPGSKYSLGALLSFKLHAERETLIEHHQGCLLGNLPKIFRVTTFTSEGLLLLLRGLLVVNFFSENLLKIGLPPKSVKTFYNQLHFRSMTWS